MALSAFAIASSQPADLVYCQAYIPAKPLSVANLLPNEGQGRELEGGKGSHGESGFLDLVYKQSVMAWPVSSGHEE